jgi:hypothetical protein
MNTLFLLIAKNSKLELKTLGTKANLTLNVEGMEKLIFTNVHFVMSVVLKPITSMIAKKQKPFTRYGSKDLSYSAILGRRRADRF